MKCFFLILSVLIIIVSIIKFYINENDMMSPFNDIISIFGILFGIITMIIVVYS